MSRIGSAWLDRLLNRKVPVKSTSESSILSPSLSTVTEAETSTSLDMSGTSRIFALVVAIDRYKEPVLDTLTGCRNDGQRFINFLTSGLGVPLSQIKFLADQEATRTEILKQFDQFLIRNVDIRQDDAIVFYFAGHGSRFNAPPGWVSDGNKIETLCPHDVRTIGDDGNEVWDIPDRTINALMRKLASEKGNNIVAIFDCCHSGGLSRNTNLRIRSIPPPLHDPPADLDREIWASSPESISRSAQTVIQSDSKYKSMASHVLLAACRSDEFALEDLEAKDAPGGLFTTSLVDCLHHCSIHDTTYSRLFEMLDLKQIHQHPQCEGANTDRVLFSVNTIREGEITFRVSGRNNKLWVSAGSIHGVVEGTEFSITSPERTFVLKAKKVGAFQTVLENLDDFKITSGRATVSNWNHPALRVHTTIPYSSPRVTVVPSNETADVALYRVEPGKWTIERFDLLIATYATRVIHLDADIEQRIGEVLDAIANFNSYLYRSPYAVASFSGKVEVRFNRIGVVQNELGPVGDNLLNVSQGAGLKQATITDFDARYSITLENFSDVNLFPYIFYFDPSDYSVQVWYKPLSASMTAPLARVNTDGSPSLFAFGYGGFGTDPIECYLPPGQDVDTGFVKVFLTTAYVDMNDVFQSPITENLGSSRGSVHTLRGTWACETFVLTCRKP